MMRKSLENRDVNVDLIRVLACLIVIGVHVNNLGLPDVDKSKILWMVLLGDGVAFFFILMGFFLFQKSSFLTVLKKAVRGVFIPALALMAVSRVVYPFVSNEMGLWECILHPAFDVKEFLGSILNWTPGGYNCQHLWYVFSYMQIILLFPFLKPVCDGNKSNSKIIFYLILVSVLGMLINDIQALVDLPIPFTPHFPIMIPAVYAVTGCYIYKYKAFLKQRPKIGFFSLGIAMTVECIRFCLQIKLFQKDLSDNYYLFWNTGMAYIVTSAVIIFILSLDLNGRVLHRIICFIGERTFGIYLVHYMMIPFLDCRGFGDWLAKLLGCDDGVIGNSNLLQEIFYIGIRMAVIFGMAIAVSSIPVIVRTVMNLCRKSDKPLFP